MSRTLQRGSTEFVVADVTEIGGQPLTGATVGMAIVPYGTQPTVWSTPTVEFDGTSQLSASLLVTAAEGTWAVYVRLTDSPEQPILLAGLYNVL